jgi:hypothetical protein
VQGTAFDEISKSQVGHDDPDPLVRFLCACDLDVLCRVDATVYAFRLAVEDLCSARYPAGQILGLIAAAKGVRITSTEQALRFIDMFGHLRGQPPTEDLVALGDAAVSVLIAGVHMIARHRCHRHQQRRPQHPITQPCHCREDMSLPARYAALQDSGTDEDAAVAEAIRLRLQDPTSPPRPAEALAREIAEVRSGLPEQVRDDPEAQALIHLIANGLHTVFTLYGDPEAARTERPTAARAERRGACRQCS